MHAEAVVEARRAYILAPLDGLRELQAGSRTGSPSWSILTSAIDQCEGNVPSAIRRLETMARNAQAPTQDVRSLLVPLLISVGEAKRAAALMGSPQPTDTAPTTALFAVLHASSGKFTLALDAIARAEAAIDHERLSQLLVHHRLALAAYYLGNFLEALENARAAMALAQTLQSERARAAALSVAYAATHAGMGNVESAWHLAGAMARAAALGGDRSRRALGEVALYEMAVERNDLNAADDLRQEFIQHPLPEQYHERFTRYFADICYLLLKHGRYDTAVREITALEQSTKDAGQRSACKALRGLCNAALGDVAATRRDTRQAIALSSRPKENLSADDVRLRRIARAVAFAAGFITGDAARGYRSLQAKFVRNNPEVLAIVSAARSGPDSDGATTVAGYAHIVRAVAVLCFTPSGHAILTAAEVDVLQLLSDGHSSKGIAELRGSSVHTIRTHVRNAVERLSVRGRLEAIAKARKLGLLKP